MNHDWMNTGLIWVVIVNLATGWGAWVAMAMALVSFAMSVTRTNECGCGGHR